MIIKARSDANPIPDPTQRFISSKNKFMFMEPRKFSSKAIIYIILALAILLIAFIIIRKLAGLTGGVV